MPVQGSVSESTNGAVSCIRTECIVSMSGAHLKMSQCESILKLLALVRNNQIMMEKSDFMVLAAKKWGGNRSSKG